MRAESYPHTVDRKDLFVAYCFVFLRATWATVTWPLVDSLVSVSELPCIVGANMCLDAACVTQSLCRLPPLKHSHRWYTTLHTHTDWSTVMPLLIHNSWKVETSQFLYDEHGACSTCWDLCAQHTVQLPVNNQCHCTACCKWLSPQELTHFLTPPPKVDVPQVYEENNTLK